MTTFGKLKIIYCISLFISVFVYFFDIHRCDQWNRNIIMQCKVNMENILTCEKITFVYSCIFFRIYVFIYLFIGFNIERRTFPTGKIIQTGNIEINWC